MIYKGCTFTMTTATTTVPHMVYGRQYERVARLWSIAGQVNKPAGARPFLTSARACQIYVDGDKARRRAVARDLKMNPKDPPGLRDARDRLRKAVVTYAAVALQFIKAREEVSAARTAYGAVKVAEQLQVGRTHERKDAT